MVKRAIVQLFDKLGYRLQKKDGLSESDMQSDDRFMQLHRSVEGYTMTSMERMYALYQAVLYVHHNNVEGDFVECGVWKGGSSMLAASGFKSEGDTSRSFYLYDTFEGMSDPDEHDISVRGEKMVESWEDVSKDQKVFCYSTLEEVQHNFSSTGYPMDKTHFIKGKVEDTIPGILPHKISILRLDTDWYSSTYHELVHLFPLLVPKGVLIIDDYGHWQGARLAVDTYFAEQGIKPLLSRIDYTGRLMVKLP